MNFLGVYLAANLRKQRVAVIRFDSAGPVQRLLSLLLTTRTRRTNPMGTASVRLQLWLHPVDSVESIQ